MGRIIPYIVEHKKCLKPPISLSLFQPAKVLALSVARFPWSASPQALLGGIFGDQLSTGWVN